MTDRGSANSNSWTILTQEETAALSHRPVLEEAELHGDSDASPAEHTGRGAESMPAEGAVSVAQGHPMEAPQQNTAESHDGDASPASLIHDPTFTPSSATYAPPSLLDVEGHPLSDSYAHSQSEGLPEGTAKGSADLDSFSESSPHVSLSPEGPPAPLLTPETLGTAELMQEEDGLTHEGPQRHLSGQGLEPEGEESELAQGEQAEEGVKEAEGEPELRRRSLLATLERVGRREEDEETEEEFQLHRREEESGLSLNKCILGAVILLGLGTIFFSESDYGARDPRDTETPVKQDWLSSEVPQQPVDVGSTELLNKLAKGNQQISVLQAQLQAQEEELKLAKGRATEGAVERVRREEVEKENGRLKNEMASLHVLLKENEKMKRELESVRALQKELETLRATVTGIKLATVNEAASPPVTSTVSPPTGQAEDSMQAAAAASVQTSKKAWEGEKKKEWKKEERKDGNKVDLKGEKRESKEGGKWKEKEWKKETDKESIGWKHGEENRERGEGKKENPVRGDEGKPWKDREGNNDRKEKNERKKGKEEKLNNVKEGRGKQEKQNEDKQWGGKEGKQDKWNDGKDWRHKEGKQDKFKEGKEWHGKEKRNEGKEWRDKDAKKDKWNEDKDLRGREGKQEKQNEGKEWRDKQEKQNDGKEWRDKQEKQNDGKEWRDKEGKREKQNEGKEWRDKQDKWNEDKEWRDKEGKQEKQNEGKEWRDKQEKQNDGKEWRDKQEKQNDGKEWRDKQEKQNKGKEWRDKEGKREKRNENKEWRDKEEKRERHRDWPQDKEERRNDRDGGKESGKEKRDWRQKGEKEEWKKDNGGGRGDKEWKEDRGHSHEHDHRHGNRGEHLWQGPGDRKPPAGRQDYWPRQKARLQRNPGPPRPCDTAESCAGAEGLVPVPRAQFQAVLGGYLATAEGAGADPAAGRELGSLAAQFFDHDDVFAHDRMSFLEFADDLGDILEDMVEGLGMEGAQRDALEEQMDGFEEEVTRRFSLPGPGGNEEERKESGRARG